MSLTAEASHIPSGNEAPCLGSVLMKGGFKPKCNKGLMFSVLRLTC